jgi:hypothetical protein
MATLIADKPNEVAVRKTANGDKTLNTKAREFIHKTTALANVIKYEISPKNKDGVIQEGNRAKYFRTNASMEMIPDDNLSEEEKNRLYEILANDISGNFEDNFLTFATESEQKKYLENQSLTGSTDEDRKRIQKAFLAYSYVISLHPDEAKGLTEEEKANLLHDMNEFFIKKYTNSKEINSLYTAAVHFNTDKPHLHGKLASYDFDGRKLNLQDNYDRFQQILIQMEANPKFNQFIFQINTNAAAEKQKPILDERVQLDKLINSCFSKEIFNFKETHELLKSKGVVLKPFHNGKKLEKVLISRKGSKTVDYKYLDTKVKVGIQRYLELKRIQDNHPKYPVGEKLSALRALILEHSESPKEALQKALEYNGFELIENRTKNGHLNGLSIRFKDIDETVKMSTIGIEKKYLENLHIDLKTGEKFEMYQSADGIMIIDACGRHKLLRRTTPKTKDEFCFMEDSGWYYYLALQNKYSFSNNGFYQKGTKPKFRIVEVNPEEKKLQVAYDGSNPSDARAVIQLYLVNGFKGLEITRSGSPAQSRELWRQGQLLGAEIVGYEPNKDDLAWLKTQRELATAKVREKNLEAFQIYKAEGKAFDVKIVANQFLDVDRKPIAFAVVDLIKLGLSPTLALDPPRKGKKKATEQDFKDYYHFILATVAKEAPELLEKAKQELEAYKPADLQVQEIEPVKPAPAASTGLYDELNKPAPSPSLTQEQKLKEENKNKIK